LAQSPAAGAQGPAERLLAHRAELSLSAEQVQKLEAIDRKYDQQDQAVVAKLEALRGRPVGQPLQMRTLAAGDRERLQASRTEMQPLMQQLRASHVAAVSEMRGVLSAEQSTRANGYIFQGRGQGQSQGQGQGRAAGRASLNGRGSAQGAGGGMMSRRAGQRAGRGGRGAW